MPRRAMRAALGVQPPAPSRRAVLPLAQTMRLLSRDPVVLATRTCAKRVYDHLSRAIHAASNLDPLPPSPPSPDAAPCRWCGGKLVCFPDAMSCEDCHVSEQIVVPTNPYRNLEDVSCRDHFEGVSSDEWTSDAESKKQHANKICLRESSISVAVNVAWCAAQRRISNRAHAEARRVYNLLSSQNAVRDSQAAAIACLLVACGERSFFSPVPLPYWVCKSCGGGFHDHKSARFHARRCGGVRMLRRRAT